MQVDGDLDRAESLRSLHSFKRVVLWLQHRELWDERWGKLAVKSGI
jgi:hypothetical protein